MKHEKVQAVIDILKEKGEKITPARKGILEVLADTNQLLSVAEVYGSLRNKGIVVNYSTVYRTLDRFFKNELVEKLMLTGEAKYQLLENHHHVHHLICKDCHSTQPINFCPYNEIKDAIKTKTNFLPVEHRLEIYGYCSECQKKHDLNSQ